MVLSHASPIWKDNGALPHYGSANLIYRVNKQFSIGVEGLYGRREVHDGRTGDDFRMQLSMIYRMFE